MKSVLTLSFVLLMSGAASAMTCVDQQAGPDRGYSLQFAKNMSVAQVSETTIAESKIIAQLGCQKLNDDQGGSDVHLYSCYGTSFKGLFGDGYEVSVHWNMITNQTVAILSATKSSVQREVAQFTCR